MSVLGMVALSIIFYHTTVSPQVTPHTFSFKKSWLSGTNEGYRKIFRGWNIFPKQQKIANPFTTTLIFRLLPAVLKPAASLLKPQIFNQWNGCPIPGTDCNVASIVGWVSHTFISYIWIIYHLLKGDGFQHQTHLKPRLFHPFTILTNFQPDIPQYGNVWVNGSLAVKMFEINYYRLPTNRWFLRRTCIPWGPANSMKTGINNSFSVDSHPTTPLTFCLLEFW